MINTWILIYSFFAGNIYADTTSISIPMQNGLICYERSGREMSHADPSILYHRCRQWVEKEFAHKEHRIIQTDQVNRCFRAGISFRVNTAPNGNHYWLKPELELCISDTGYVIRLTHYYEKPVEPGITNDYSKIEYRWWDYRKGHPWSNEDTALFTGLNKQSLLLLISLEKILRE